MMFFNLKATFFASAAAALLLAPGFASAQPGGMGPGGHGRGRGPGEMGPGKMIVIAERLGVSDATLRRIKDKVFAAREQSIDLRGNVDKARLQLHRLLDADAPDESAIMKQIDAIGKLEIQLRKSRIGLMLSVHKLLTPAQRKQLRQLMAEHRGPRGGWDGHGHGK